MVILVDLTYIFFVNKWSFMIPHILKRIKKKYIYIYIYDTLVKGIYAS